MGHAVPDKGAMDAKFTVEQGYAIMLGKPTIAMAIPRNLCRTDCAEWHRCRWLRGISGLHRARTRCKGPHSRRERTDLLSKSSS